MTITQRYDRGKIEQYELTDEGYLRCQATVARIGMQKYYNADGSERIEFRPPEEVANPDSLATYGLKPHTDTHPPEFVDSGNIRKYQTGTSDSTVCYDKGFVKVVLNITDKDVIDDILGGRKQEISCGYTTDLVWQPGEWNGKKYDAIQTNIRVNHIASVPKGRAGSAVRIHLDNEDLDTRELTINVMKIDAKVRWTDGGKGMTGKVVGTFTESTERTFDGKTVTKNGTQDNPAIEIEVDGGGKVLKLASEVSAVAANKDSNPTTTQVDTQKEDALTQRVSTLEAMLTDKRNDNARLSQENANLASEIQQLTLDAHNAQKEVKRLQDERSAVIAEEVSSRMDAWNKARELLPKSMLEEPNPKLSATAIMRAAIENTSPSTNLDGASDEYIKGCFETTRAQAPKDKTSRFKRALTQTYDNAANNNTDSAGKTRQESQKKDENAWMTTN